MLTLDDVSHNYGSRPALRGVSLQLREGVYGLIGENGAGKTTLLKLLSGGLAPTHGRIVGSVGSGDREMPTVALMPQTAEYPKRMTAFDFVTYLTWLRGEKIGAAERRARESLDLVALSARADSRMSSLSGGMVRRVWLAQALAANPEVLLLDEPSTGLDPRQRQTMIEVIDTLDIPCVVMSSHIIEDIVGVASHIVALREGAVQYAGPKSEGCGSRELLSLLDGDVPC